MGSSYLYLLPLTIFVLFPATIIITYTISILLKHTEPVFPYISDTGTYSPESCIFGQALNIGALAILVTIYVRYRQIAELYHNHSSSSNIVRLNRVGLFVGSFAALGISIAANFQETNVLFVHLTGALMTFGLGTAYLWVQAVCSYQTHPLVNSLAMAHIRMALAVVAVVFFVIGCVCASIALAQFQGKEPTKWYPEDGGWGFHVASTVSEWVCAASFNLFMLTLVDEFKCISMDPPQVHVSVETLAPNQYSGIGEADQTNDDVQVILSSQSYIT
ncbi:DNA damage-regulated autophagy modulator protein 2-like [Homarus americanus]|uniref:DNA damage-regulated autophagy modulator protein 2-like n=1 Tax=Homarus americanus TaxID=6706 RepID=UPI001C4932DD|nr:DNA damage-regulated autophagy modulator protein 2-like [Homarus americanus]